MNVYISSFCGSFWKNAMPMRSMRARLSLPIFCSVSDSDIGKTLPFAQTTTASVMPAASSASKTAGRMRDCGVGRNWLSITIATLVASLSSSLKRGPDCGCSSACAAAAVASATASGSSGRISASRLACGMSISSVSRYTSSSFSAAPMVSGSIDSYGITARCICDIPGAPRLD